MKLSGSVVLITGANRGIGLAFAKAALSRGARRVYAAARSPAQISMAGVEPLKLDVTSAVDVAAAAKACPDVTLVINNAGIARMIGLLVPDGIEIAQQHFDTNVLGMLRMTQAFAPVLAANGGGAFLNVLSVASWINSSRMNGYAVSKSAAWGLTNGLRNELRQQNTQVLGMHMAFIDTDMTVGITEPKSSPETVVGVAFDALEAGLSEVLADERTRQIKRGITAEQPIYL
jgi:NAD(P)-dependent dehydrogenase (short-subunit alcohol dehydrogenase family)